MNSPQQSRNQILLCPTCNSSFRMGSTDSMPFCSDRCKQIDLGRWFNEEFGLPVDPEIDPDEEAFGTDVSLN